MKAIMVMYDSLRLDLLPCYGGHEVELPNFRRLAERTAVFDEAYVCSLPCMPARRELHTGRPNFLHRSWGPIEPFDDSMPELLSRAGIHTHLSTDHYHYLQDGGATYQERYTTWECFRGQEHDKWKGVAENFDEESAPHIFGLENMHSDFRKVRIKSGWQNDINRRQHRQESDYPQAKTFDSGLEFIAQNAQHDNWFLQIETFDPHEPFDVPRQYEAGWFDPDKPFELDWPPYAPVRETKEIVENVRKKYCALLEFCDKSLGRVLDAMDQYDLWKDTMLIVNTDHGFLIGEHDWWGKNAMPDYQELVHVPLFIWDPRCGAKGVHRRSLVQTIDIAPTLLDFFGVDIPKDMTGQPLSNAVKDDEAVREYAIMGYFGGPVNITDGRYLLMRAPVDVDLPIYEYTLMPTHMNTRFSVDEMRRARLAEPFEFTKGCPVLQIPPKSIFNAGKLKTDLLFDLQEDPEQKSPIHDAAVHNRLTAALKTQFDLLDAPEAQYVRYGLSR